MTMKQDITIEQMMLDIDAYADEVLRDHVNCTCGSSRSRATVVIQLTRLFAQIETSKMKPCKEIEGVAV